MKYGRLTLVLCTLLALNACKLRIIAPEGGSVTTESGTYTCNTGSTCDIDIVDFFFDETFTAEPLNGYEFRFWRRADRRFCARDTKPCRIFTEGWDAFEELAVVIETFLSSSDEIFYLEPVFRNTGVILLPLTQENVQGEWEGKVEVTSPAVPGAACRWDIRSDIEGPEGRLIANLTFDNAPIICESFVAQADITLVDNGTKLIVTIFQNSSDLLGPNVIEFVVGDEGTLISDSTFINRGVEVNQIITFVRP
ncbi:MAG: hypothetical protein AAGI44_11765 [Pseudomonadota bacterium]